MLMELLKFGIRRFKVSRTLEDTIDQAAEQIAQGATQAPQGPDPATIQMQQKGQLEQQKLQQEGQLTIRKQDQDFALKQREQQLRAISGR